jgi:hypothetical protein
VKAKAIPAASSKSFVKNNVAAVVRHVHRHAHSRLAIGHELHVVGRAEPAIALLHVSVFGIGRRAAS